MKISQRGLFWRPTHVPARGLVGLAIAAVLVLITVENWKSDDSIADYDTMLRASATVESAIEILKPIRGAIEPINPEVDPFLTGFIGVASSSITSTSGQLEAKQTAVNPNWAAVVVRLLREAGVEPGDTVAIAVSGSFPMMNLAVYAAVEAMGLRPIIIASASASQWGANVPGFTWIDMARELREAGIIRSKAVAATLGGRRDRALGIPRNGEESLRRSIERAGLPLIEPGNLEDAVARRIATYQEAAAGEPFAALINVGGGSATTGPDAIDHFFDNGLIRAAPNRAFSVPSVMGYFLGQNTPVIHLSGMASLAARHGLPSPPSEQPRLGEGGVYTSQSYQRWLAAAGVLFLLALTALVMRSANIALTIRDPDSRGSTMKPKV
ncbi:MAG: poly-gamma-glutamate system protein [Xanthomonadales bacterium]|nr:poly-gamma-glutamate system protein [Xanthomonadales bacterium]